MDGIGLYGEDLSLLRPGEFLPAPRRSPDQTDFTGPGLWLVGAGTNLALLPTLDLSADLNALGFTAPQALRQRA